MPLVLYYWAHAQGVVRQHRILIRVLRRLWEGFWEGFWEGGPAMGFTVKSVLRWVLRGFWEGVFQKVPGTSPWRVRPLRRAPYINFEPHNPSTTPTKTMKNIASAILGVVYTFCCSLRFWQSYTTPFEIPFWSEVLCGGIWLVVPYYERRCRSLCAEFGASCAQSWMNQTDSWLNAA